MTDYPTRAENNEYGEVDELPGWLDPGWQDDILNAAAELQERAYKSNRQSRLEPRDLLLVLVVEQLHYIADELGSIRLAIELNRPRPKWDRQ